MDSTSVMTNPVVLPIAKIQYTMIRPEYFSVSQCDVLSQHTVSHTSVQLEMPVSDW